MSRSGDFYIHIANLEVDFLHFLRDLLRAEGFSAEDTIIHPGPGFGRYTPDLTVGNPKKPRHRCSYRQRSAFGPIRRKQEPRAAFWLSPP
jgi:hypothetical protein